MAYVGVTQVREGSEANGEFRRGYLGGLLLKEKARRNHTQGKFEYFSCWTFSVIKSLHVS